MRIYNNFSLSSIGKNKEFFVGMKEKKTKEREIEDDKQDKRGQELNIIAIQTNFSALISP